MNPEVETARHAATQRRRAPRLKAQLAPPREPIHLTIVAADLGPPPEAPPTPVVETPTPDYPMFFVRCVESQGKCRTFQLETRDDWWELEAQVAVEETLFRIEVWATMEEMSLKVYPVFNCENADLCSEFLRQKFERMNPTYSPPPDLFDGWLQSRPEPQGDNRPEGPVMRNDPAQAELFAQTELFAPEYHPNYTYDESQADFERVYLASMLTDEERFESHEDVT